MQEKIRIPQAEFAEWWIGKVYVPTEHDMLCGYELTVDRAKAIARALSELELKVSHYQRQVQPNNWLRLHGIPMRRRAR